MIINCKEIREKEIEKIKGTYKGRCKVSFIQVGDNPASNVYVRNKIKLCEEVGIEVEHIKLSYDIKPSTLDNYICSYHYHHILMKSK